MAATQPAGIWRSRTPGLHEISGLSTVAGEVWTIRELIRWSGQYLAGHQVEAPRLSAELMLAQVLSCSRMDLYLRFDQPLSPAELAAYKELLLRRRQHEPVAYLLGRQGFHSLELRVGPGVLIPRPETELLVEEALAHLADQDYPRLLDLCTGSGAVALAVATHHPGVAVVGVDLSARALAYARANAAALGLAERVSWLQGDLWEPLAAGGGFFEVITANPPYVAREDWDSLPAQVRDYEPREALDGGPGGLDLIRVILEGAGSYLRPGGWLLIEMGQGQAAGARRIAAATGVYVEIDTKLDLAGIERVLVCQRGDYG
ncbi:MAG: peptide chain release factor N(5)-glutamine methyltransferase [Deltaproteobacteria bacterium]|nr:peptide chain release factor N(5)-glutamine methyltransferase [Deltaproteobacteria bacterium]